MPARAEPFTTDICLTDAADLSKFKIDPTLAAGDVTVFVDGVSLGNITSLPSALAGTPIVTVSLTAAEMDGDSVSVLFDDASGAEWSDFLLSIPTTDGDKLNSIYITTSSAPISIRPPLTSDTELEIVRGDSYDGRINNPKLIWSFNSNTDVVASGSALLTFRNLRTKVIILQVAGVLSSIDSSTYAVAFTLTSAQTATFLLGKQMTFDVQIAESSSIQTIAIGTVFVKEDVTY